MEMELIRQGFFAIIPSLTVIIILSVLLIFTFIGGRSTALNHLIKHHLGDISKDEVKKLRDEIKNDKKYIKKLEHKIKFYLEVLSGIRYLTRKNIEEEE